MIFSSTQLKFFCWLVFRRIIDIFSLLIPTHQEAERRNILYSADVCCFFYTYDKGMI
jgi:hypothetical protein